MQIEIDEEVEQGTEAWYAQRTGKMTGSRAVDIVKGPKGSYTAARKNMIARLVCERMTGEREETYQSKEMQWGTDHEALARSVYEIVSDRDVQETGFINHPTIANFGGSPDGLVGDDGLTEIKCPGTATHLALLVGGNVKREYIYQMQAYMLITNRKWCDFISYDPRLPDSHCIYIKRIMRDEKMIAEIEAEAVKVLAEVDAMMEAIKDYKPEITK
jgi:putative phage-type endonuclease